LSGFNVAVDLLVRLCSDAAITPAMVKDGRALAGRVAELAALSFMRQVGTHIKRDCFPSGFEDVSPLAAYDGGAL
jgi:hypothetical protein